MGKLTWVTSDTLKPSDSTDRSAPGISGMLEHSMPLHLERLAVTVLCMELALQNCAACVCFLTLNNSTSRGLATWEEVTASAPLGKAWWQRGLLTLVSTLLNSSGTEHYGSNHLARTQNRPQSPTNVRDTMLPWYFCPASLVSGSLHPSPCTTPHSTAGFMPAPHLDTFSGN